MRSPEPFGLPYCIQLIAPFAVFQRMTTTSDDAPLYNHPLPQIESWLTAQGCQQDRELLHCWHIEKPTWQATLYLEEDRLTVNYLNADADGGTIQRSFKYSLSRRDLEDAIFAGP
jgi:hypothetical protein